MRSRLKHGGFTTQWLPVYQVPPQVSRALVRAFVDVFPEAVLFAGAGSNLILLGQRSELESVDPRQLTARLRERPAVAADLRRILMGSPTEILGAIVASGSSLRAGVEDVEPVTDDLPLVEYGVHAGRHLVRLPRELFAFSGVEDLCPDCASSTDVAGLAGHQSVMRAIHTSESFLSGRKPNGTESALPRELLEEPGVLAALRDSPYLRLLSSPHEARYEQALRAYMSGDPVRAAELLEQLLVESPVHAFAYRDVGRARLAARRLRSSGRCVSGCLATRPERRTGGLRTGAGAQERASKRSLSASKCSRNARNCRFLSNCSTMSVRARSDMRR